MSQDLYRCESCEQDLPVSAFSISLRAPWGLDGYCDTCWKAARAAAWTVYRSALANGDLVRPRACQRCHQATNAARPLTKIEGHHFDYKVPLFVVWVCFRCHRRLHDEARRPNMVAKMVPVDP